jgi:hypothetical protein
MAGTTTKKTEGKKSKYNILTSKEEGWSDPKLTWGFISIVLIKESSIMLFDKEKDEIEVILP